MPSGWLSPTGRGGIDGGAAAATPEATSHGDSSASARSAMISMRRRQQKKSSNHPALQLLPEQTRSSGPAALVNCCCACRRGHRQQDSATVTTKGELICRPVFLFHVRSRYFFRQGRSRCALSSCRRRLAKKKARTRQQLRQNETDKANKGPPPMNNAYQKRAACGGERHRQFATRSPHSRRYSTRAAAIREEERERD